MPNTEEETNGKSETFMPADIWLKTFFITGKKLPSKVDCPSVNKKRWCYSTK